MFKAIKDNKIIAISDTDNKFVCLNKDAIVEDKEHSIFDYDQYNGAYLLKSEMPAPTNEEQRKKRAAAYAQEIDILHLQKARKTILGTWQDEDEENYIAQVKSISEDINNRFPYFEE